MTVGETTVGDTTVDQTTVGAAKRGPAEFRRFLDISIGSLAEVAYTLRVARDLKLLDADRWSQLDRIRRQAGMMTWKLYAAVASSIQRPSNQSHTSGHILRTSHPSSPRE